MRAFATSASVFVAVALLFPGIAAAQTPGTPGTPIATVAGNSVTISWTAPASGGPPTHYLIVAGTAPGSSNLGTHNVGPTTSVSATLPPGTYFIRVVAVNGSGQSAPSGETSFTIGSASTPGTPGTPVAFVSGDRVTVSWNPPTSGGAPTFYVIVAGVTPGGSEVGTFNVGPVTSVSASLPAGTYFVRIIAGNSAGQSLPSPETAFTIVGPQVPGQTGTPIATVVGQTVNLTWTPPTTGGSPTHYLILAGTSPGATNLGVFNVGLTTSVTATLGGGVYFVRVVAVNDAGAGVPSVETSFTISPGGGTIEGTWQGVTSQGVAFAFVVSGGQITMINAGAVFNDGSCAATAQSNVTVPITAGQFSHNRANTPGTIGWSIQGTFASTTSASGSITATANPSGSFTCSGTVTATWTATNFGIGAPLLPRAPSGFTATVNGTAVTFTWDAPPSDPPVTTYQLEIGTSPGATNIGVFTFAAPATSHTRPALSSGTYFARLRARNQSGAGPASTEVSFTIAAVQLPGAPFNLTAAVNGATVNFFWSPPTTGGTPTSYDVEIGTTSGGVDVGVFNTSSATYSRSLTGGSYFARVRARNAAGAGPPSNEIAFAISNALPGIPTGLQATVTGSSVTFTWSAPTTGSAVASYDVEIGTSSGASDVGVFNTASLSHTVDALVAGTYFARVKARNGAGTGPPSAEVTFTISSALLPRAPAGFSVFVSGTTAQFSWAPPAGSDPPLTSYDLEIGTTPGASNVGVFSIAASATTHAHSGMGAGTYYARLRGRNSAGVGPASTERSFTIVAGQVPGAPTNLVSSVNENSVTLTWSAPATGGTPTSYLVEIGTANGASNIGSFLAGAGPRSYSRVLPNGTYFARVRGQNSAGEGPASNEVSFTIGPLGPGTPVNVVVTVSTLNDATIEWSAPTTGTVPINYELEIGRSLGASNTGSFTVSTTSRSISSLSPGIYYARVKARDASGLGPPSHEIAFEVGAPTGPQGWPMYGRNAAHQGRATANGPTDADVAWTVAVPSFFNTNNGPVVGPDGSVYLTSWREFVSVTSAGGVRCRRSTVGASAPAVAPAGGTVYVPGASELLALNPLTCAIQWSLPIGTSFSSPTVARDGTIYIASAFDDPNQVYAINPNGTIRWTWNSQSSSCGFESSPAIGPTGDIYVHHNCLGVIALDANGVEKWRRLGPGDSWNSPSVGPNGTIYVADSPGFHALNLDGTVRWNVGGLANEMRNAAAAISADGRSIYRGDNNGFFYAFDSGGTVRWTHDTGRPSAITGAPAIAANGLVYFTQSVSATEGYIYAVRESDGGLVWQHAIGSSNVSPAIGPDGTVYVAGSTGPAIGTLYAFRP